MPVLAQKLKSHSMSMTEGEDEVSNPPNHDAMGKGNREVSTITCPKFGDLTPTAQISLSCDGPCVLDRLVYHSTDFVYDFFSLYTL